MDRAVPGQPERRARDGLKSARSAVGTHRFRSSGSIAVSLVRRSGEALPVGWTKEGIPRRREYDRSFLNRQTRGHVSARAGSMPERWSHLYHAGGLLSISNLRGLEAGTAAKRSPGDGGSQLPPRDETSKPNGVDCFVSLRPPRNDKEEGAAGVGPPRARCETRDRRAANEGESESLDAVEAAALYCSHQPNTPGQGWPYARMRRPIKGKPVPAGPPRKSGAVPQL
jgi:hypothetical protein